MPDFTPYGRPTRDAVDAAGHLVRADGADAEALGAGDAERGHLHAVPLLLRRHRVEPAAAVQRPRRLLRQAARRQARRGSASSRSPAAPAPPAEQPRIAVFQLAEDYISAIESTGWLRYLLDRVWKVDYDDVTRRRDRRAAPSTATTSCWCPTARRTWGSHNLGDVGRQALRRWVNGGGHLIAWRGGTEFAAELGLTTAALERPDLRRARQPVPGRVDRDSPLHSGVGDEAYAFYEYDERDAGIVAGRRSRSSSRPPTRPRLVHLRLRPGRRGARRDRRRGR